jgi:hypothetical protein
MECTSITIQPQVRDVVVKVAYPAAGPPSRYRINMSESVGQIRHYASIFRNLSLNLTTDVLLRHYALPQGIVVVPSHVVFRALDFALPGVCEQARHNATKAARDKTDKYLVSTVMEFAGGREVNPWQITTTQDQVLTVRGIVCIYQYLVDHQVSYADMDY